MRPLRPFVLPDARRTLRAVLLALVVALFLGGGLGFVAAAGDETDTDLDTLASSFGTAEPMIGDRGVYTKEQVKVDDGTRTTIEEEARWADFEWVEHGPVWDVHGKARHTVGLVFDEPSLFPETGRIGDEKRTWLVDPASAAAHALLIQSIHQMSMTVQPPLGDDGTDHYRFENVNIHYPPRADDEPLFCGLFHSLQGTTEDVRDGIVLLPFCRLDSWGGPPEGTLFEPEAVAHIGEETTLVLHAAADPTVEKPWEQVNPRGPYYHDWQATSTDMRVWLSRDSPYPLRIEAHDVVSGFMEIYRLAGLERGDASMSPASPLPPDLPTIETAPLRPWGPDDTDAVHPYSLGEAFQGARDDPTYPGLRDFLERFPDADVTGALTHPGSKHDWVFTVTSDTHYIAVCASRRTVEADGTTGPQIARHETCAEEEHDWLAYAFSTAAAKIRSLQDVWSAIHPDIETNGRIDYGFYTECGDSCHYFITIGVERTTQTERLTPLRAEGDSERTTVRHTVHFGHDGRILKIGNATSERKMDGGTPLPDPGDDDQDPVPLTMAGSVWVLPDSGPIVGTALVAFLTGLAYWLWPTVKSGLALPLFSRVQRAKALDHPVRAELFSAVETEPGIHFQEMVRRTGHAEGQVQHHLGKLVDTGLLQVKKTKGYTCYFPGGRVDRATLASAGLLKSDGARSVFTAVATTPGTSGADIAEATGLARQTVAYHLKRLVEAGLLERERNGAQVLFRISDQGAKTAGAPAGSDAAAA
ncbi:MAG: helix-turn-helix domain-containing protein [Euryarchaeota archaeon]|nr:helix-turn-helix domain-containing protein [Euryarchaeota archaeon]